MLAGRGLQDAADLGPAANRVRSMPHLSGKLGEHYSGYIRLPDTSKRYYYWLATSQSDPVADPLAVWYVAS